MAEQSLIGVDGGGTSCRIALVWRGERFDVECGSANVFSDMDAATATITTGLERVADAAGLGLAEIESVPAYLGLAGVIGQEISDQVRARLPLRNALVEDDRITALAGSLGERNGAVASIGTGSFLARQAEGQIRLIGGHGLRLGDEASGAWLGRALLARVLHCADGLDTHSALTGRIVAEFNHNTADIVKYAGSATPQSFARFAPEILAAARADDAAALELFQCGTAYICRGLQAIGYRRGEPLCLVGGLGPSYAAFLPEELAGAVVPPAGQPLDGALALAARHAGGRDRTPS